MRISYQQYKRCGPSGLLFLPRCVIAALGLMAGTFLAAPVARAAPVEDQGAIYDDALALQRNSRWRDAIRGYEKLDSSKDLRVRFHLAECYEKLKQVTEAWSLFRDLKERAANKMQRDARKHVDRLETEGPQLVVELPAGIAGLAGLEVKVDDVLVPWAGASMSIPVVRGPHELTVGAAEKVSWKSSVPVEQITKIVGPATLEDIVPARRKERAVVSVGAASPPVDKFRLEPVRSKPLTEVPLPTTPAWPGQRTAALVTGGLGLVSLTVGAVFGVLELKEVAKLKPDGDTPSPSGTERARADYATVANVGVTAGLGLSAAAVILALTSTSKPTTASMMKFVPVFAADQGGLVLYGSF